MKKIILATFTLLGVMSVNAQKNSIFLGTDFGYHRVDDFDAKKTNKYTFSPVIAYEVADNWFVGATTSLSYNESSSSKYNELLDKSYNEKNKNYETRVGGFVRYYQPFNDIFGIYGDLGAGYLQNRLDRSIKYDTPELNYNDPSKRVREYGYYINFVPALFINFKNNFGLNVSFGGFEWSDTKTNTARDYVNSKKTQSFDLTFGKEVRIGISKKFSF